MAKHRQYTRELLAARAESDRAYREGRGPRLRIVTQWGGSSVPVAYEPRSTSDPRPWVMYDGETGTQWARFTGRHCWAETVTEESESVPTQSVGRSVLARVRAAGIETVIEDHGAGYLGVIDLVDSRLTWSGVHVFGYDVGIDHPIGEHGGFWAQNVDAEGFAYEPVRFPRYEEQAPDYGRDSAAFVAWLVLVVADDRRWAEERGLVLACV